MGFAVPRIAVLAVMGVIGLPARAVEPPPAVAPEPTPAPKATAIPGAQAPGSDPTSLSQAKRIHPEPGYITSYLGVGADMCNQC